MDMADWKWLQVRLPEELHRKFMIHSIESGVGMSELVRGWVGDAVKGVDLKVGSVVLDPVQMPVSPKSGYTGVCSKCGAKNVKTTINRDMKEVCYKCAGVNQ